MIAMVLVTVAASGPGGPFGLRSGFLRSWYSESGAGSPCGTTPGAMRSRSPLRSFGSLVAVIGASIPLLAGGLERTWAVPCHGAWIVLIDLALLLVGFGVGSPGYSSTQPKPPSATSPVTNSGGSPLAALPCSWWHLSGIGSPKPGCGRSHRRLRTPLVAAGGDP